LTGMRKQRKEFAAFYRSINAIWMRFDPQNHGWIDGYAY
jgi:hypothetical protein